MKEIINYLENDFWHKIFNVEDDDYIEYKLLEREEVQILLKEIERLNQRKQSMNDLLDEVEYWQKQSIEANKRIDEAIEYIKEHCILSDCWKDLDFCNFVPVGKIKYKPLPSKKVKDLLDILKGEDE